MLKNRFFQAVLERLGTLVSSCRPSTQIQEKLAWLHGHVVQGLMRHDGRTCIRFPEEKEYFAQVAAARKQVGRANLPRKPHPFNAHQHVLVRVRVWQGLLKWHTDTAFALMADLNLTSIACLHLSWRISFLS